MSNIQIEKQGEFNSGWSQNRPGQRKKLSKQMTEEEKDYLVYAIRDIKGIVLHPHLKWKRDSGQISFDIISIHRMFKVRNLKYHIKEYSIIELEDGRVDHRVLIRSNRTEMVHIDGRGLVKCNLMFVLSLDTNEIVTAYYVHIHNHFDKPNMDRYDEELDVIETLSSPERIVHPVKKERQVLDDLTVDEWLEVFTEKEPNE